MKLINVTNSYTQLVTQQLENTDAELVQVYSLGKTTVIHSEAATHCEIVLTNKTRKIKTKEIDVVLDKLVDGRYSIDDAKEIVTNNVVEFSIPIRKKKLNVQPTKMHNPQATVS